ncbi:MAG: DMT family transporter [Patescibacteria group bacterium]
MKKNNSTYFVLLFGVILWGMFPIITHKFVLSIDPLFLVSLSVFIASIPFIIQLFVKKEFNKLFSVKILKTLLPVAFFTAIGQALLFIGTKLTSGVNTGLLLQTEPIYSLILGTIFLGEIVRNGQIGATLLMVIGAMTIVYRGIGSKSECRRYFYFTIPTYVSNFPCNRKKTFRQRDRGLHHLGWKTILWRINAYIFFFSYK